MGQSYSGGLTWALFVLGTLSVPACSDKPNDAGGGGGPSIGDSCRGSEDCKGGQCIGSGLDKFCSFECESDKDCPGDSVCADWSDGTFCVPGCAARSLPQGYACVGGRPELCERLEEENCTYCGCPEGSYCDYASDACGTQGDVGAPCATDDECISANCSGEFGVCRVEVGAPCTAANCDICYELEGASICTVRCTGSCPQGFECMAVNGPDIGECMPVCGAGAPVDCPSVCDAIIVEPGSQFAHVEDVCDCPDWCDVLPTPTAPPCAEDAQCTDGLTCNQGLCVERRELGESCEDSVQCVDGFCCNSVCKTDCMSNGSPCSSDLQCAGACCEVAGGPELACQTAPCPAELGVECTVDRDCLSGRCAVPIGAAEGQSVCVANDGDPCDPGGSDCAYTWHGEPSVCVTNGSVSMCAVSCDRDCPTGQLCAEVFNGSNDDCSVFQGRVCLIQCADSNPCSRPDLVCNLAQCTPEGMEFNRIYSVAPVCS